LTWIREEQRTRWQRGERIPVETWLEQHPGLRADEEAALLLIYQEVILREERGETPQLEEYLARFPQWAAQLRDQFEVHGALASERLFPGAGGPGETVLTPGSARSSERAGLPAVPGYRLLRELGRGAMGVVFRAWQTGLERTVALKMILAGGWASPPELARFRIEAEAAGRLEHPHIVRVYELGEHDGQPWLAMEYVDGGNLAQKQAGSPLPVREAARLAETLARAIHHAHQKGVVHRDLKPANILLTSEGVPKVSDFGLAKLLAGGPVPATRTGAVLGTPSYMAPEQAGGRSREVGPPTDVYALGALLYEMLTGRPPFQGENTSETLLQVLGQEPVPPRRLRPEVPPDLETICLHCLEKEPGQRYVTALDLAEDLRRFLADLPIAVRPIGNAARVGRWCRRNPALAAVSGLAVAACLAALGLAVGFGVFQYQAAAGLRAALAESQRLSADHALDLGLEHCARGDGGEGMLWLADSLQQTPAGAVELEHAARLNLAAWRTRLHESRQVVGHPGAVSAVALSPDGRTLLTGCRDGTARLWDAGTGRPIAPPLEHHRPGSSVTAAAVWASGLPQPGANPAALALPAARLSTLSGTPGPVAGVAFSPDGETAMTWDRSGQVCLWNGATGEFVGLLAYPDPVRAVLPLAGERVQVATARGKTVRVWGPSGQAVGGPLTHPSEVRLATFTPDGKKLLTVSGTDNGEILLWDLGTGSAATFPRQKPVQALASSPDGTKLLIGTRHWKASLWDTGTRQQIGAPLPHPAPVSCVAFSPDGQRFLTGCSDGKARVWDTATAAPVGQPLQHQGHVTDLIFSADGEQALTASNDGTARLWGLAAPDPAGRPLQYSEYVNAMAFSPDGRLLLTGSDDKTARLWDTATGKPAGVWPHADEVHAVAFSGDGRLALTGCDDGTAQLRDAATGERRRTLRLGRKVRCLALDRNGDLLVTGGEPRVAVVWDGTGERTALLPHDSLVGALALSPDGSVVVTGGQDGTARLWTATGAVLGKPLQHRSFVRAIALSPDGTRVLTGSVDTTARLWDAGTGTSIGAPLRHESEVSGVAFSPDGKLLATGAWDDLARLWDSATRKPVGPALRHGGLVRAVAFRPDGQVLLSASADDNVVRHWAVPAPVAGEPARLVLWVQVATGLELDGEGGVRVLDAATWQQRRRDLEQRGGPP
jgi:WD40 repeat protein